MRTLIPCSRVLVELLSWRRGAEKRDKLPKISLCAFNLLQTDKGGDDLTATGDGDKDTCKVETDLWFSMLSMNPAFYLVSGVWIWIGTFVWSNVGNRLPLCDVMPPLFGLNLQTPSERCKPRGPLASLLFLTSITSTFHIWNYTYLDLQLSLVLIFYFLPQATSGLMSPCIMVLALYA